MYVTAVESPGLTLSALSSSELSHPRLADPAALLLTHSVPDEGVEALIAH